jgi:succinate-semialdehyde dehydrogenase/glutarate-semialdehyde dehydrogenase
MPTVPSVETETLAATVSAAEDRDRREVIAPANGEQLGTVPECIPEDVETAFEHANDAQESWAARSLKERGEILWDIADAFLEERSWLADVLLAETGKARADAIEEVFDIAVNARYYASRAGSLLGPARRQGAIPLLTKTVEHRHPKGAIGLIVPWNYPLTLAVSDALPALLAGNSVVLKPAEETPFSLLAAARLLYDAGVPEDCFQVVTGDGATLGEPLIEAADLVGFTGGTETGRIVAETAGRRLTETSLELGGKNPMVVLSDADVETAAEQAVGDCFANAGQLCLSIERIYVQKDVFGPFRDAFLTETRSLDLGVGTDWGIDVGSLQSPAQLDRVQSHVDDAVDRGASLLAGGRHRPDVGPFVYEPTILTDVPEDATLHDEETFGPVVRIEPVPDAETAIERVNDSQFGLNGAVWTGSRKRGEQLASRIECGTVSVNGTYLATYGSVDAPMGGHKESGMGRRHGRQGIEKYTDSQTVAVQRGPPLRPGWMPDRLWARTIAGALRGWNTLSRWWPR